jgi:nitrite reductase/ring-hydroxylating ferredoxin subunit
MSIVKIGSISEFEDLEAGKLVEVAGQSIAVFNIAGKYYAIANTCPHRGGPLADGMMAGEEVICPWHGARFNVKTRSNRSVPLGPKGVEILSARKPADVNPEALIFATRKGAPLSRRNLLNRQLMPASKQVGLKGINWHWLRHANATLHESLGTAAWEDITPLARNEWICWIESAKKAETRIRRIAWGCSSLKDGKRRPCCWPGCAHR